MFPTRVGRALVIITPDAIARGLDLRIRHIIETRKGLKVKKIAERRLLREEVQFLYHPLLDAPNYLETEEFMTRNPVEILSVTGPDAPARAESIKHAIRKMYKAKKNVFPEFKNAEQNLMYTGSHPAELLIFLRQ